MEQNAKVVLFLEDEKALNYKYKTVINLTKDIEIKSLDYDFEKFENEFTLISESKTSYGDIYFLHPYKSNTYVNEKNAEQYLLHEKLNLFRRAASLLGAVSISSKVIVKNIDSIETDTNGKVRWKIADAGIDVKTKSTNNLKSSLEIYDEYKLESNYNHQENLENLRKFIEENNLNHELQLIDLIEGRDYKKSGTSLKKKKIKTEITQEYNNLLEISARLKSPVFSLNSSFHKKLKNVKTLEVEIEYNF